MSARAGTLALLLVLAALVLIVVAPGAAFATPVPSSGTPLPGSSFLGGDGNQDNQAPFVDWQALEAAGRVVHSPDPNADDGVFSGGSKELQPRTWGLSTDAGGAKPSKANILDAWSAVDQPGDSTYLYLGFSRQSANGGITIAFELNHDPRLWFNGRANIPCRRTGDAQLVLTGSHGGLELVVERWTTTVADPATACGAEGRLDVVDDVPAELVQGAANPGPITSRLPGFYAPGSTIRDAGLFAEAALNLGALLGSAIGENCLGFGSIWMHSRSSSSASASMQDYVAPQHLSARTCAASGVKFSDDNANGRRDGGEPGLPRFVIWADYDNDGVRDPDEPFTVTDDQGRYLLQDIAPPGGSYRLRETLLTRSRPGPSWVCSFPNAGTDGGFGDGPGGLFGCGWGAIVADHTPFAQNRDFGNYRPATLTVKKNLWPASDPGRFDLAVNGETVLAGAGDDGTKTVALAPGTYDVSEQPLPPALAADYRSTVSCRVGSSGRGLARAGTEYTGLVLRSGDHAECTFVNVRPRVPAIAIEKTAPDSATAGDALRYTMAVTNPGDRPIAAASVHVTDRRCDAAPVLVRKAAAGGSDRSPKTLDRGEVWTYSCTRSTSAADCPTLHNVAKVEARSGGAKLGDEDGADTELLCPTAPPGAKPPAAGDSGGAGISVEEGGRGCVARARQVQITGSRMSGIAVRVDGRTAGERSVAILQRSVQPFARLGASGSHRISVRVTFEQGSGTPPVTLARMITVCALSSPPPSFTG